jgi:hypothetical protein
MAELRVSNGTWIEEDFDIDLTSEDITVWVLEVEVFDPEASPCFTTEIQMGIFETYAEAEADAPEDAELYSAEVVA